MMNINDTAKYQIYQKPNSELIRSNINYLLASSGYSVSELSSKINISAHELKQLQNGKIGINLIYKICSYFKLTPGMLTPGELWSVCGDK